MDVSLNIKNEHVHDLVRRAAERTGLSQTSVVERAIEQLLASLDDDLDERRRQAEEILEVMVGRLSDADREALGSDLLYDEDGLPA